MLGKGGMGAVYYAHDPVLNRYVAIKQMLPMQAPAEHAAEQMRKQFLREAQILRLTAPPQPAACHRLLSSTTTCIT